MADGQLQQNLKVRNVLTETGRLVFNNEIYYILSASNLDLEKPNIVKVSNLTIKYGLYDFSFHVAASSCRYGISSMSYALFRQSLPVPLALIIAFTKIMIFLILRTLG